MTTALCHYTVFSIGFNGASPPSEYLNKHCETYFQIKEKWLVKMFLDSSRLLRAFVVLFSVYFSHSTANTEFGIFQSSGLAQNGKKEKIEGRLRKPSLDFSHFKGVRIMLKVLCSALKFG